MSEPEDPQDQELESDPEADQSVSQQLGFSGPGEELAAIETRMGQIREEVTTELLATWPSPWKNDAMVNAKVTGRLGSNKAFQVLLARQRELQAELGTESAAKPDFEDAEDPMGSYSLKIARDQAENREIARSQAENQA